MCVDCDVLNTCNVHRMNSYLLVPSLARKESDLLETYVLRGGLRARPPLKERIHERPCWSVREVGALVDGQERAGEASGAYQAAQ